MSSSAIRDITKASPSKVSSRPAMPPTSVERETRRTSRIVTSTSSVPKTSEAKRQPKEFIPNSCSPPAISHLPTGGCTMNDGDSSIDVRGAAGDQRVGAGTASSARSRAAAASRRPWRSRSRRRRACWGSRARPAAGRRRWRRSTRVTSQPARRSAGHRVRAAARRWSVVGEQEVGCCGGSRGRASCARPRLPARSPGHPRWGVCDAEEMSTASQDTSGVVVLAGDPDRRRRRRLAAAAARAGRAPT